MLQSIFENIKLKYSLFNQVEGPLKLDAELFSIMLEAPYDLMPDFTGPAGRSGQKARGKDHPRYGRFVYAFAKHIKPELIVEVGSYAGGTAIGWANALRENGSGKLICVDNDTYSKGTYPAVTTENLTKTGLNAERIELLNGDSHILVSELTQQYPQQVDIYLVDGDHTYEGALADIKNGACMVRPGGFILIHDVDRKRNMCEATAQHPYPVYEALMDYVEESAQPWCILKFIRKHLAIIQVQR